MKRKTDDESPLASDFEGKSLSLTPTKPAMHAGNSRAIDLQPRGFKLLSRRYLTSASASSAGSTGANVLRSVSTIFHQEDFHACHAPANYQKLVVVRHQS
jgi:hypothetical protein